MSKIYGIFPLSDDSGFMTVEWKPDPEVLAAKLLKMARDTENWEEPLAAVRAAYIYDTELHFETQSDPYGQHWEALDPDYAKEKERDGYPEDILTRTGDLRAAATSEAAWQIDERSIIFNVGVLPFYGPYHQAGTRLTGADVIEGEGGGRNLPQRQFIGANEDTIAEIEAIFVGWLNRIVDEDWGKGGGIVSGGTVVTNIPAFGGGTMIRGAGGRFTGVKR